MYEVTGLLVRQSVGEDLSPSFFSPIKELTHTDRLDELKCPEQVFDISVAAKLPTITDIGLVEVDNIGGLLLTLILNAYAQT